MKTNNLLTYLLYALLGLLIIAAGYKACQMQEEKKRRAEDEAELEKMLRDKGYVSSDSTDVGSSYSGDASSSSSYTNSTTSNGIEGDNTTTTPTETTTKTTAKPSASTVTKPVTTAPTTASKPVTSTPSTTTTTKSTGVPKSTTTEAVAKTSKGVAAVAGPGSGRWAVRAGTFSQMEGARRRLEEVIRMGYPNAEISKTSNGQAAVVVFRSNDKNAAIRVMDKLEEKGIDAAVFDRKN